jgi:hypothetical protein
MQHIKVLDFCVPVSCSLTITYMKLWFSYRTILISGGKCFKVMT